MPKIRTNYVFVIMGVSGSGKSTIGKTLSQVLNYQFVDADDFHSEDNIAKMKSGLPLSDDDRALWLQLIRLFIENLNTHNQGVVLACSALKKSYRDVLSFSHVVVFIYLKINKAIVYERLQNRINHFAGTSLIDSQFETLEEPENAIVVDANDDLNKIIALLKTKLINYE